MIVQNTFAVDLEALSLGAGSPFKVRAEYGGVSFETTPITNSIVDLAIEPSELLIRKPFPLTVFLELVIFPYPLRVM